LHRRFQSDGKTGRTGIGQTRVGSGTV
jgi:hypothetical protein